MQIKRTFAPDIRQAIRKVREEQGPDAVILGNRKVDGGIEIISAIDYDQEVIYESLERQAATQSFAEPTFAARSHQEASYMAQSYAAVAEHTQYAVRDTARENFRDNFNTDADAFDDVHVAVKQAAIPPQPARQSTQQPNQADTLRKQFAEPQKVKSKSKSARDNTAAPAMDDMRRELKALRGLMENQLSVLEWNRLAKRHPTRVALLNRFNEMDLGIELARQIVDEVAETDDLDRAWRMALGNLAKRIPIGDEDLLNFGGVVALVGSTGVGKTTTVAKLAARFAMQHGQRNVALVTTDTFRIGAHEQLLHFARILGVPLHTATDHDELGRILAGLYDKKLVLIDTAGMSQRDLRLTEQFATIKDCSPLIRTYLVMSANTQLAALDEVVRTFGRADLAGCIVTKLDEAASLGGTLTVSIRHQLPIAYLGTGQRVPEDIQPARAHRLVSRAVPLSHRYAQANDEDAMALKYAGIGTHANF